MKLNLGCGTGKMDGYVNVDVRDDVGADMVFDISRPPYPVDSGSIEEIHMSHVLEHISYRQYPAMLQEFRRIMREDATLIIRVPDLKNFVKLFNNYLAEMAYTNSQEIKLTKIEKFWVDEGFAINGEQRHGADFHPSIFDYGYYWMLLKSYGFVDIREGYDSGGLVVQSRRGK